MSESEQNLAGQQIQEEKLRRYLLGECSANETAEIERAAFQDSSVSDALSVIEDELTEDYVCDQLNDLDRSCFELKFLTSSERREKLRLSALLLNRTEVLRRVPPGLVRAHQLMSEETKEALESTGEVFYMNEPVTGGDRDALDERMPASIPPALGSASSRWKRWIALGAAAGLLFLTLYGVRGRLWAPTNPAPVITSAILRLSSNNPADSQEALHAYPGSEQPTLLIVNGVHFAKGAIVQWNGSNLQTIFVDSTKLIAVIPEGQLMSSAAKIGIVVANPPPGGGASSPFIQSPTLEK